MNYHDRLFSLKATNALVSSLGPPNGRGYYSFERATPADVRALVDANLAFLDDEHNDAPTLETLLTFAEDHSGCFLSGYVVTDEPNANGSSRNDCRVTIDQIEAIAVNAETMIAFVSAFHHADEFHIAAESDTLSGMTLAGSPLIARFTLQAWWD